MTSYNERPIVVTGGASFIGSHLVDALVAKGARVTVIDDLSSGRLGNLGASLPCVRFERMDLEYCGLEELRKVLAGNELVFHLAAVHGGRGYIATHPADVCSNFAIDHHVLDGCRTAGVERVIMASSACVYPPGLQASVDSNYLLREEDTNPFSLNRPLSADIEYGWAKVMGEIQLISFVKQYGMKGANVRFVTAYGPRENETHAIIALIAKAYYHMDPYVIWGTGKQNRDFTYVSDIVDGTIRAAEEITDGTPVNLGTGVRYSVEEVAQKIFEIMGFHPKSLVYDSSKPVGVVSRALDISRARKMLGWEPRVSLEDGLRRTIEWYVKMNSRGSQFDERLLLERS